MAAIRGYSRVYTKFLNALVTIQYFAFSGSDSQLGTIGYFKNTPRAQCRRCYVQQYAVEHRATILAQRRARNARNAAARVVYRATPAYAAARERLTVLRAGLRREEKEALVGIQL